MAKITDEFVSSEMFRALSFRSATIAKIITHLESSVKDGPNAIIETGTAWMEGQWFGQGQSTLIWDWVRERMSERDLQVFSLDIREEAIETASKQTKHVKYLLGDSVKSLADMPREVIGSTRLLYLDSFDWTPESNLESSYHHMAELATVWSHLPSGCLIVVDDRHSTTQGKHVMVQQFMRHLGIKPLFCEYQIGWIKS